MASNPRSSDPAHHDSHASTGLGTILLFVLLALIASVAAGVLVNTIGLLEPGSDGGPPAGTSDAPVTVDEPTGHVTTANTSARVTTVVLTVTPSGATDALAIANLTVDWFGPTGHTTLTYGNATEAAALAQPAAEFAGEAESSPDEGQPRPTTAPDRVTIAIDAAALGGGEGLAPGTTVAIKLTTETGATHFLTIDVPATLTHQTTVTL